MSPKRFVAWLALGLIALSLFGCGGPRLDNDTLYGVWMGEDAAKKEKVMVTFILGGKCDIEYTDRKPKVPAKGQWRIAEGKVEVTHDKTTWKFQLTEIERDKEPALQLAGAGAPTVVKI